MDDRALSSRRLRRPTLIALAGAASLIVAACGGTPSASSGSPAPSSTASPAASSGSNELKVEAQDFAFVLPASTTAGATHITLANTGKDVHQAQIARLNDGVTFDQVTTALKDPDPSGALRLVSLVGGPNGVEPGKTGAVDLTLEAGTHIFVCFIAGADSIPHIAKGMIAQLEVTEPAAAGDLPQGDAALTLQDFAFVGLDTLTAGKHTITVTNKGPQAHEAGIVRLAEGVTVPDVIAMLNAPTPPSGPPPFSDVGGIAGMAPGSTATLEVDLPAGNYALVCYIPDPATGKPHLMLGMIGALTVE